MSEPVAFIGLDRDSMVKHIAITEGAAFVIAHTLRLAANESVTTAHADMLLEFAVELEKACPVLDLGRVL